ncbi:flagellar assembly protein FliW [Halalkalibacter urbisdiaboli]|uniref:flagellar assembly protein FliW n=1 Tax=Halalkalibacter urbisdiaboli TaxID=1960589 RepID=UPI000B439600|nr:flagellar assembly protein FliW [Halalkalibacter urbisdiaboli]
MIIETKYSNSVEVTEDKLIQFENGLPAFEDETSFVLLPFDTETPFYVLQSVQSVDTAFIVVNPFEFVKSYQVKIPDSTLEQLEIEKEEEVAIFVTLTVREPFSDTTANLQGPIIVNTKERKGKQIVLSDDSYQTKHPIFKPVETATKEGK